MARLVLGDNHVVFLDALSSVLTQHGHAVCPVARSADEMLSLVRRERPDVCVVDRYPATGDDTQTIGRVRVASDTTNVLVISADPDTRAVGRALDAGAAGYLHQSRGISEFIAALERVLLGEVVVDVPHVRPTVRRAAESDQALRLAGHLTSRERQCLMMLVEGLDTAAMMDRLRVSRTTVRTHLQAVLTKLGVHSRLEAVSFAVRHRLPDLWSAQDAPAAAVSIVHPIRPRRARAVPRPAWPRQAADLADSAGDQHLAVAAGQVAGSR